VQKVLGYFQEWLENSEESLVSVKEGKPERIFELRKKGYTYDEIRAQTGYSKGTMSYHLGEGQKEKTKTRLQKFRKGICRKVVSFIYDRRAYSKSIYSLSPIRKKAKGFVYGPRDKKRGNYKMNKSNLKYPFRKVWTYLDKIWPGIKSEKESIHAVNQWTGELDYEKGEAVRFPNMRCKLSGNIYNAKESKIHSDHIDGNRLNNSIENFSFILDIINMMKGQMNYKQLYDAVCKIKENMEQYREKWDTK